MTEPNVLLILADDLGFSDLGCYGSEIRTPNLDALADAGVRLTGFHNAARCSPSRASLLTGLHPHQTGVGMLTSNDSPVGYTGNVTENCATAAEMFASHGYQTAMFGKWHLAHDTDTPNSAWPTRRGFDYFYGSLMGGNYYRPPFLLRNEQAIEDEAQEASYYYTDALADEAVSWLRARTSPAPFFLYLAFTAPHWPLHAREEDIARYEGTYERGWDVLRRERMDRQIELGMFNDSSVLTERSQAVLSWDDTDNHDWQARRMRVYAAQVETMDRAIGRVIDELRQHGKWVNTVTVFLSDNGASAEELHPHQRESFEKRPNFQPRTRTGEAVRLGNVPEISPGSESTYASYGEAWANLSNTPYRFYKRWTHQGGIAAPFILSWPAGRLPEGSMMTDPVQLVDVLPTLLDTAGLTPLRERDGLPMPPLEGTSFVPEVRGGEPAERVQYWEHCGNAAIRTENMKLVREFGQDWELYDLGTDPTEKHDLASVDRATVDRLATWWQHWADRCGVINYEQIVALYDQHNRQLP